MDQRFADLAAEPVGRIKSVTFYFSGASKSRADREIEVTNQAEIHTILYELAGASRTPSAPAPGDAAEINFRIEVNVGGDVTGASGDLDQLGESWGQGVKNLVERYPSLAKP